MIVSLRIRYLNFSPTLQTSSVHRSFRIILFFGTFILIVVPILFSEYTFLILQPAI